jgi:DNA-binding NarL/FixJ family response regulator
MCHSTTIACVTLEAPPAPRAIATDGPPDDRPQAPGIVEAPPSLAALAELAREARGNPDALARLIEESSIPIVLVDGDRCYTDANPPARLLFRKSLAELRQMRIEDVTPPEALPMLDAAWDRLVTRGSVSGPYPARFDDGSRLDVVYWALAYAMRDRHLIVFLPADWSEDEVGASRRDDASGDRTHLTPREREVLRLAAQGRSAPQIAGELVIGESTVKTHLANIYAKLGVPDRAAAVATAIRRGLIE